MIFAMHDPLADLLGEWSRGLNTGSVLLRIALAVLLASVIGCERSSKRHSAGLRTFVLVSFASTVSMLLDVYLMSNFGARLPILSAATVIAAALLTALPEALRSFADYRMLIYAIVLILVMLATNNDDFKALLRRVIPGRKEEREDV